ncbi:MAG: hypothetical protein [Bacteriophage sp.]|nr:MAG: hypothetical protein [Bacteriophage sp.]
MSKYKELVDLLDEVGVLQLEDEWAVQIQSLIKSHAKAEEAPPKDCPVCDGWGSVSTGIDESPSTLCKACDGNGSLPK